MDLSNQKVLHVKKSNQEFLQFKKLLQYSDTISHAYSLGINKSYRTFKADRTPLPVEEYKQNMENYKELCMANGVNYKKIVKANQAHTDNIEIVEQITNENIDTPNPSDGLITDKKDIVLATTNADCILFLMFDPIKKVIANIHSGWKGTLQRISVKAVEKMKEEYGSNPRDIVVCICPSIRKCHFEVDKDVYEMFYNEFKNLKQIDEFIIKDDKKEKWYIDTVLINKIILKEIGILEENIEDSNICSVCNSEIVHSFRKEGPAYGLATAIISLK